MFQANRRMDVKATLIQGLTSSPKYIPVWYRYDKQGSVYNDDCLEKNEHYYLHTSEMEVLTQHIQDIIAKTPENCSLVDFGSGNSEKTRIVIDSLLQKKNTLTYVPVDISEDFIREVCSSLSTEYGNKLTISPVYGDYDKGIEYLRDMNGNKLIVWFGSLQNLAYDEQVRKLQSLSSNTSEGDRLLLSLDITDDPSLVYNAYLDPEAGLGITLSLKEGECINLYEGEGVSCKYTQEQITCLIKKGNLQIQHQWKSKNNQIIFVLLSQI